MGTMSAVARQEISWIGRLGDLWCRCMHNANAMTWPAHGHYRCRVCHREYTVPWEEHEQFYRAHVTNAVRRVII
jgi:hypothetical protein